MRGLMFNYLLECIEYHHNYEIVDTIIEASNLKNQGSYADGGIYKDTDFIKLIITASKTLQISNSDLLQLCGKQIFLPLYNRFLTIYNQNSYQTKSIKNAFDFISMLEEIHYKEIVKLYPDSIFPHFEVIHHDNSMIEIVYHSERNLSFLAKGLINGCIEYFDEALTLEMENGLKKGSTHFIIKKEII